MAISIYEGKDGRARVYIKETQKLMSYPKYLMEQELGRPLLPNEEVHHKDENPLNNDISNLQIRLHGEHQAEHATKYHDVMTICGWCGREFLWTSSQQSHFYSNQRIRKGTCVSPFCSRQCAGKYSRHVQLSRYADTDDIDSRFSTRKLSNEQARYIRDNYVPYDSKYGGAALARQFGVSKRVIEAILNGETYRDI